MRFSGIWTVCFLAMLPLLCAPLFSQIPPRVRQIDVDEAGS